MTVAENWWESETNPIALDTIQELLGEPETGMKGSNPKTGEIVEIPNTISFLWPKDTNNESVRFFYNEGNLSFNCRDEAQIETAKDLASIIGAKVQGGEGEFYESSPTSPGRENGVIGKKPKWNQYASIVGIIIGILAAVTKYVFFDQ